MFKIFWYRYFKYPTLMTDDKDGIKSFAERRIAENLKCLRGKISSLNSNTPFDVEHNPEFEAIQIPDSVLKDNLRKKFWISILLFFLILAEGFLNYISLLVAVPGGSQSPWLFLAIRVIVAAILTILSIRSFEYFFELFLHEKFVELKKNFGIAIDSEYSDKDFWTSLSISLFFLVLIGFIVEKRANAIELGQHFSLAYYGLIMLSLILPVFGGRISLELKRSRKICDAAQGKNRWAAQIRRNQDDKSNIKNKFINSKDKLVADTCSKYWMKVNDFKTVKLAFQRKQGSVLEDIGKHKGIVDDFKAYQKFIEESLLNS